MPEILLVMNPNYAQLGVLDVLIIRMVIVLIFAPEDISRETDIAAK